MWPGALPEEAACEHARGAPAGLGARAWNAYLAAAPEGPFAPEARYNRAITLVRLGRLDEARRALEPFARDVDGGYRTREARTLLEAMASPPR